MKNKKFAKAVCLMAAIASILAFPVKASAATQGTDGTELEVVQAQQVEIQLGPNWSGVEFEMKTDAGMYPGTIPVGEDGILRFEVGGSESYILSCMNSKLEAPVPDETVEATENTGATGTADVGATIDADPTEESVVDPAETDATDPAEIPADAQEVPVVYVVITAVAVLLAVSALAYLILGQKKSDEADEDDDL